MMRLTRFTRTTAFKLSLLYIGVFTLLSGFLLVYISQNTNQVMSRQVVQTVDAELSGLSETYLRGGIRDLVQAIDWRARRPDASLYLLTDFAGNTIAGNIARLPTDILEEAEGDVRRVRYSRREQGGGIVEHEALVRTFELSGGFRLLVGRDLGGQLHFSSLFADALRLWLVVVVLMGAVTWLFVSRRVMKRIDEITATSRTIMKGDLSGRLPVAGNDDEFDRLATSLNAMLERIEFLMQSMRDVTDNIAHDLKTPLTRQRNRVETALREAGTQGDYRQALETTLEETDQLLRIFNALLKIARIEAMAPGSGLEPVDVTGLVEEVAELYTPLVEDEGGKLAVSAAPGLTAMCNKDLIGQGLVNLIENALKYGRSENGSPEIAIGARSESSGVVLTVSDRGSGIPEPDADRVLDRFVRLDESRSEPGTGLGLSLVNAVARLHGGDLRLKNMEPGLCAQIGLAHASNNGAGYGPGNETDTKAAQGSSGSETGTARGVPGRAVSERPSGG